MAESLSRTVAVIGCGSLGSSFVKGLLDPVDDATLRISHVFTTVATAASKHRVEESLSKHLSRLTVLLKNENLRAIDQADLVVIAFKPVKRHEILLAPGVQQALRGKLVISIMAGITIQELSRLTVGEQNGENESQSWGDPQLVRAMPNMAAKIREATTLFTANTDRISEDNLRVASWIFNQVGTSHFVPEDTFDISAVLVGCAGSLLLLAIDGLLDAAVAEGVKRSEAQKMAVDSAIGMLKLIPAGEHPSVLREKIASPGGCSIRALLELEKRGVRSAYTDAIMAAAERSKMMSRS